MPMLSTAARGALLVAGSTLAFTVAGAGVDQAQAQGKLTANYTISVARIPVGKITWSTDIGDDSYTSTGSGEASGVLSFLASGKGSLSTQGTVKDGQLSPTEFTSDITQDDEKGALKMVFDQGSVTELKADAPAKAGDRVAVTAEHQQGVIDPLTAWLIPAAGEGNGLGRAACERTLPIFDGQKRYDLKLTFKRMDKTKTDKGYDGPALVCAVTFQPIAGHRAASPTVKFPRRRPRGRTLARAGRGHARTGADPRVGGQHARKHRGAGERVPSHRAVAHARVNPQAATGRLISEIKFS